MLLQWVQRTPELILNWRGPNTIQTTAIASMADVEAKIAVISGPKGDKGDPGNVLNGTDASFTYSPPSAQATWVISHNLGKFPSVTILDTLNRLVTPEVTYLSINLVEVAFAFATSGTAYLN